MVSQKVTIKNPTGLHLRPAGILCKEAMQFKSLITFNFRENTANAVHADRGRCIFTNALPYRNTIDIPGRAGVPLGAMATVYAKPSLPSTEAIRYV